MKNKISNNHNEPHGLISKEETDGIASRVSEVIVDTLGDLNVSEFSRRCGIGESTLRNILKGAKPRADKLKLIAKAGSVSVDWIISGKSNKYFGSLGDVINSSRKIRHDASLEESQWIITKEALKNIDRHWFNTSPGEPNDPLEQFVRDYNSKKILPNRNGLLKLINKITTLDIKEWGRRYFAWESRLKHTPLKYPVSTATNLITGTENQTKLTAHSHSGNQIRVNNFVTVPKYDLPVTSGGRDLAIHSAQIVDHLAFKQEWLEDMSLNNSCLALIAVKDDSMEPTLRSDDLILTDTSTGHIENNSIYVLRLDNELIVKRIQRKVNGSVIVKSDNPVYGEEEFDAASAQALPVIGKVIWYGRRI